jgi:hypothetical protein
MKDRVGNILKDVQGTDDEGEKQPDFVYLNESEKIVGAKVSTNIFEWSKPTNRSPISTP